MAHMGGKRLQGVVVGCIRRTLQGMEMDGVDPIHLAKDRVKWWGDYSGIPGRCAVQREI
jgi:hypothetical protein